MTSEEIINYVATGSSRSVCVFRERLEGLSLLVMSFYIMGKPSAYVLSVEFDPIDMINYGEGWVWLSTPMELDKIVTLLEKHLDLPVSDWENITKSGKLSFYDDEIDNDQYRDQEKVFKGELQLGSRVLPKGFDWQRKPSE